MFHRPDSFRITLSWKDQTPSSRPVLFKVILANLIKKFFRILLNPKIVTFSTAVRRISLFYFWRIYSSVATLFLSDTFQQQSSIYFKIYEWYPKFGFPGQNL
jgi:hypothetical protein